MIEQPLITKYRPVSFVEMAGHGPQLSALQRALSEGTHPHSYLLTGPGGIGKTSTARIIASMVQAEVIEIDAASRSGVDDMRQVVDAGMHMSLMGEGARMFIIDECHALSKGAWQALLKITEEPPSFLYFALCTTDPEKVPDTIKQRCFPVQLRPLSVIEIQDFLAEIMELEGWQVPADVVDTVVRHSGGSPRKALSTLQAVRDAESAEEVARIISLGEASSQLIDLCKGLAHGDMPWTEVKKRLGLIPDEEFESAQVAACRYLHKMMLNTDHGEKAARIHELVEALIFPTAIYDRKTAFIAGICRFHFGGK